MPNHVTKHSTRWWVSVCFVLFFLILINHSVSELIIESSLLMTSPKRLLILQGRSELISLASGQEIQKIVLSGDWLETGTSPRRFRGLWVRTSRWSCQSSAGVATRLVLNVLATCPLQVGEVGR